MSVLLCIAGLFSFNFNKLKSDAYDSSTLPTGDNAIGNLYNGTTFNRNNLLKFAKKVGFNTFTDLVDAVENGTKINATQIGNITVALGSYDSPQGVKNADLVWMPTRLSKDDNGNVILTLWLANAGVTTSTWTPAIQTIYDQETSPTTDRKSVV